MSNVSVSAAIEAVQRGYQPIPVRSNSKRPYRGAWTHDRHDAEMVAEKFEQYAMDGATNLGLLLGEPSGGLVDVDLDSSKASRLRPHFLPKTDMVSGRAGRPRSHYWYQALPGTLPANRRYQMPDGEVSVELRSTGSQTVIPPSVHPAGDAYRWEGNGGEWQAPAEIDGRKLALQVALLGLGCVLIDNWPRQGGRHEAYLALAGGLLRYGDDVHPWWERNVGALIRALAVATRDEDGPAARESETLRTTVSRLRAGQPAVGFGKLEEILGEEHVKKIRRLASDVEQLGGFKPAPGGPTESTDGRTRDRGATSPAHEGVPLPLDDDVLRKRDPLEERDSSWSPVDLDPYLLDEITLPKPGVLFREDGVGLFYPGRVNCLYGQSESAKSWIALVACTQEMAEGARVMYLDFEDEPSATIARMRSLGVGDDDIRHQFTYLRPEDPLEAMQRDRWGNKEGTSLGRKNSEALATALTTIDPSLIIVDGMTVIYGLHGLDTNDASGTDIITNWLKSLTRNGRSTVIVIDHTGKNAPRGSTPLGSQHKVSMVQGTALQVHPIDRPMPGRVGLVELIIGKDRPGQVRANSTEDHPQVAAEVILDSSSDGRVEVQIRRRGPNAVSIEGSDKALADVQTWTLAEALRHHIPRVFGEDPKVQLTGEQVRERLELQFSIRSGYQSWWKAMDALRKDGILTKTGARTDAKYHLTSP